MAAQRGWRRFGPASVGIAVLVLVVGLVTFTSCDDPAPPARVAPSTGAPALRAMSAADLNAMWTNYANSPGVHWTGGDRTVSVDLPGGRLAWLFSDTFLGPVNPDGSRPAGPLVHNSLVLQDRTGLTRTLHGGSAAAPTSLMCDDAVELGCWVGDAVVDGNYLRVVVNHYKKTGPGLLEVQLIKTSLVTLTLPALAIWEVRELRLGPSIAWGQSLLNVDGYTYIYGSEETVDFNFLHLARVPTGKLQGDWEYWTGSGWSLAEAQSMRLASGVGTSFSVDRVRGQYVLVSMESHLRFNPSVVAYTAQAPQGPFTDPVELFQVPELTDQRPVIAYDATLHPNLARPGTLLFSYNVNSLDQADVLKDATLYRPRFVEVAWPPATRDPNALPAPPQTLAARPDEDGRVRLSWAASAGPDLRYRVYQKDLTAGQIQWVRLPKPVPGTSVDLDLLKNGHSYDFRVTAEDAAGESGGSNQVAATAVVAPPDRPTDLGAVAEGSGDVSLTWTAPKRAWLFAIERRDLTTGGGFTRLDHPKAAESKLTAGDLTHNHEYEFRVRAVGGGGPGPWASVRVLAWKGYPLPPGNLVATAAPGGTVTLTWTDSPGEVTYRVYQRDLTAVEQTYTERRNVVAGLKAVLPGLTPGHEYEFVVTATNRAGESGRSLPARAAVPSA